MASSAAYALNECAAGYRIGAEQSAGVLRPSKQRWFSAADREMQAEIDGARREPADHLSGSGGRAAGGLASYRLYQHETSLAGSSWPDRTTSR